MSEIKRGMMPKWEYLFVRFYTSVGEMSARNVNGRELNINKPMHEYVNQLGEEGWEMVGSTYLPPPNSCGYFVFKRPKD